MKKILASFVMACSAVLLMAGAYKANNVKAESESTVYDSFTDPRGMSDEEIAEWQERNTRNGIVLGISAGVAAVVAITCSIIYDVKHKNADGYSVKKRVPSGNSFSNAK